MTPRIAASLRAIFFMAIWVAIPSSSITAGASQTICSLEGENFMAFGNYDPMSNNSLDLQGRVSYRCAIKTDTGGDAAQDTGSGSIVQISLSPGNAGGFNRYMNGPQDRLQYNLYMDPQRQTVWGDGTGGTRIYSEQAQLTNRVVSIPVYGRIFGAQDIGAGAYSDQLIVTFDF